MEIEMSGQFIIIFFNIKFDENLSGGYVISCV
jgi:hypothetical protein